MIVSYGGHGGGKCAAQLRQVADGLHMQTMPTMPGLSLSDAVISGAALDPDTDFASHVDAIRQSFAELSQALRGRDAADKP